MEIESKKIAYIYHSNLIRQSDRIPAVKNRASMIHDLIKSYSLLQSNKLTAILSEEATETDLKVFHSTSYIDFMKKSNFSLDLTEFSEEAEEFGLTFDCHLLENNYDLICSLAGGSITAAKAVVNFNYDIAINWFGGWHHAQRDEAEGFCYVNDCVLAIHKLSEKYSRVMYIDLDVHHGNGVQNAFELSNRVLTLSFHKYGPGVYPGGGSIEEIGIGLGKYHCLNVPFIEGIGDEGYLSLFRRIFPEVCKAYNPMAFVVQCGGDILCEDSIGGCNVTLNAMGECIQLILLQNLPTIFLGGGGYNYPNTARYWTYLTALILNIKLDNDIPDISEFFMDYAPSYELKIPAGNKKDLNSKESINKTVDKLLEYCFYISNAVKL